MKSRRLPPMMSLAAHSLAALASILLLSCRTAQTSDPKIIGGSKTSGDPAVVAIYVEIMAREKRFMCTGALIAPDTVLTAAHCLDQPRLGFAHVFRVYAGDDLSDKNNRPKMFTGRKAFFHPKFNFKDPKGGYDIGLLKLNEPMDIEPIPYLRGAMPSGMLGEKARVVGFGQSNSLIGTGSEVKRTASVKLEGLDEKFLRIGGFFHNVCNGDSGGPVMMIIDGVETIVGVNSFGDGSCHSESYATRLDQYSTEFMEPILSGS